MLFKNIFNEWYAAQTSKKLRAVNNMKSVLASIMMKKHKKEREIDRKELRKKIESDKRRVGEMDNIIERLYEFFVLAKHPEERFQKMFASY